MLSFLVSALAAALDLDGFDTVIDAWVGETVTHRASGRQFRVNVRSFVNAAGRDDIGWVVTPLDGIDAGDFAHVFTANSIPAAVRLLTMLANEAGF